MNKALIIFFDVLLSFTILFFSLGLFASLAGILFGTEVDANGKETLPGEWFDFLLAVLPPLVLTTLFAIWFYKLNSKKI